MSRAVALRMAEVLILRYYPLKREKNVPLYIRIRVFIHRDPCRGMRNEDHTNTLKKTFPANCLCDLGT